MIALSNRKKRKDFSGTPRWVKEIQKNESKSICTITFAKDDEQAALLPPKQSASKRKIDLSNLF